MDIEEMKKYAKNKIEADDLIKQVRKRIKETIWEKQNQREGFSETFKPLISQFEKPEDPKTKNIFTQNQEMLRNQLALTEGLRDNQLALTEGLRDNQKAITDGFSKFERLADMKELPGVEAIDVDQEQKSKDQIDFDEAQPQAPIAKFGFEEADKYLNNKQAKDTLKKVRDSYVNLPSYYFDKDISEISSLIKNVTEDITLYDYILKNTALFGYDEEGYSKAIPKNENPRARTIENIKKYNTLSIYLSNLHLVNKYKTKSGSGIFYNNPQELLKRFELLNGSLVAGNNGVLPEYIQIAHRLRDLGIITNNQLNTLLRKVI